MTDDRTCMYAVWMWVTTDAHGEEGLMGCPTRKADGHSDWMPFVAASLERAESFRLAVEHIAKCAGKPARLVRFGTRTVLEEVAP